MFSLTNTSSKTRFIPVLFLFAIAAVFISCDGLEGSANFKELLEKEIEYANAPAAELSITNNGYGTVNSNATQTGKVTDTFNITYLEGDSGYQFVSWQCTPSGAVEFGVKNDSSTTFTIINADEKITVYPKTEKRPTVTGVSPAAGNTVEKNSSIYITFSHTLNEEADLSGITVVSKGESCLAENKSDVSKPFLYPKISGNKIVIEANTETRLNVKESGQEVTVNIPAGIFYSSGPVSVTMKEPFTLKYKVNNDTIEKATITFENTNTSGGILNPVNGSTADYNIGESFVIQYNLYQGYVFNGFKRALIISGEAVEESGEEDEALNSILKIEPDETDSTKATVTVLKAERIKIRAGSTLSPAIADYEPKYTINGVECDSTVTVNFNTLMDHSTLFNSDGTTSESVLIRNKRTHADYSEYFNFSALDVNGVTVLYLKADEAITELFDSNPLQTVDIEIYLDKEIITTTEANGSVPLAGFTNSFYYRINRGTEQIQPEIKEIHLYKKATEVNGRLHFNPDDELTAENINEWGPGTCEHDSDTGEKVCNAYHKNQARKLYVRIVGFDADSGLRRVNYTEKPYKNSAGTESPLDPEEYTIGNESYFTPLETFVNGNLLYEYTAEIPFSKNFTDGIEKFSFALEDRAGNRSQEYNYYVVRDQNVDVNSIQDSGLLGNGRFSENGIDHVMFKFDYYESSMADYFYENVYSPLSIKWIKWGYDISKIDTTIEPVIATENISINRWRQQRYENESDESYYTDIHEGQKYYSFDRDETKETYIKICVEDAVGNSYEQLICIPVKPIICITEYLEEDDRYQIYSPYFCENVPFSYTYVSETINCGNITEGPVRGSSSGPNNHYSFNESDITYFINVLDPEEYNDEMIHLCSTYEFNNWRVEGTYSDLIDLTNPVTYATAADLPEDTTLEIHCRKGQTNQGCIIADVSYPESFVKNESFTYYIAYKEKDTEGFAYTISPDIRLVYGKTYVICPAVKSGSDTYIYGKETEVTVTDDTMPPEMSPICVRTGTYSSYQGDSAFLKVTVPTDYSGIYTEEDGLVHIKYWVIPNETITTTVKNRTEAEIIKYPYYETVYDPNDPPSYLRLFLDDCPENAYTIYVKVMDNSENHNYKFYSFYHCNILSTSEVSMEYDNDYNFLAPDGGDWYIAMTIRHLRDLDEIDDSDWLEWKTEHHPEWWDEKIQNVIENKEEFDHTAMLEEYLETFGPFRKDLYPEETVQAFVYKTCKSPGLNILTIEGLVDNNWDNTICQESFGTDVRKIAFTNLSQDNVQMFENRGGYSDLSNYTLDNLFDKFSGKFIRIKKLSALGGIIDFHWVPYYVYPDYYKGGIVCSNKNMMELKNGIQIFADAPVLVHTFYSSSNLGENPSKWMAKALEVGIIEKDTTFTYDSSYLTEVPEGKYYVTIAHFADGTTIMSDCKQK